MPLAARPPGGEVYPRVCGGTPIDGGRPWDAWGLSPRVRGNQVAGNSARAGAGSIPACAGEPCGIAHPLRDLAVYPRVCGGTSSVEIISDRFSGLSPRVRGNLSRKRSSISTSGSIPACAGEPRKGYQHPAAGRVYPRVCGGTCSASSRNGRNGGLSPRVRGNRTRAAAGAMAARSIPACAGEPFWELMQASSLAVYPRVCGGTSLRPFIRRRPAGLSPRVRGNHLESEDGRKHLGSIPACAGEPYRSGSDATAGRVYPRVCGGTGRKAGRVVGRAGLSPRVRGNQPLPAFRHSCARSIPACAGEPHFVIAVPLNQEVYPRVCGGTLRRSWPPLLLLGLSPRVRGNRGQAGGERSRRRSIPACAGEPAVQDFPDLAVTVYPRVCGGTAGKQGRAVKFRGLSPRVRGNPAPAPRRESR